MPGWIKLGDWMHFRHLDGGDDLDGAFTIAYKITDDGAETWSNRFARFKGKNIEAFAGGVKMMRQGIPELLANLGIDPETTVLVPALASGETRAKADGQIPVLARCCAQTAGAKFELNALSRDAENKAGLNSHSG
jgi:hypothetical protein